MSLQELIKRLETSGRVPTPPGVVVRLLELSKAPDVTTRDIADAISLDGGLAARVLRFVNSPMAGIPRQVTSLPQAVAMMGVRGVQLMALSFSIVSDTRKTSCRGYDFQHEALHSVACAVAAKRLTSIEPNHSTQEAFVAGLLSQMGRKTLALSIPEEYAAVIAQAVEVPEDLPKIERSCLGADYGQVGAAILREWGIPEEVCAAVEHFRAAELSPKSPFTSRVLRVAEIAASCICPAPGKKPIETSDYLRDAQTLLKTGHEDAGAILSEITEELAALREILELDKGTMRSAQEVEADVRDRITELSLAMHLENRMMAEQQEDLLRRATTDPLTGIGNRAAFDARLSLEAQRASRSASPLALIMIDVDHFKVFNDTYGHQAGDRVLQAVAAVVDRNIRKVDFAARYGGEEFAIIAPETTPDGAFQVAERLRNATEQLRVNWEGGTLSVTISIGVEICTELSDPECTAVLIKAADKQLYAAKCAGRNCTRITVNGTPLSPKPAMAMS